MSCEVIMLSCLQRFERSLVTFGELVLSVLLHSEVSRISPSYLFSLSGNSYWYLFAIRPGRGLEFEVRIAKRGKLPV